MVVNLLGGISHAGDQEAPKIARLGTRSRGPSGLSKLATSDAEFVLVGGLAAVNVPISRSGLRARHCSGPGTTSPKDRLTLAILEETLRRRGT
jgi:hypothetical protein